MNKDSPILFPINDISATPSDGTTDWNKQAPPPKASLTELLVVKDAYRPETQRTDALSYQPLLSPLG